jgi:hypothetical protein
MRDFGPTAPAPIHRYLPTARAPATPGALVAWGLSEESNVKKLLAVSVFALAGMAYGDRAAAQAETPKAAEAPQIISEQDLALMREDIRSKKKQLIAQNLKLTDAEATKFWPVYDRYVAEQDKVNDIRFSLIKAYADQLGTLTDEEALKMGRQFLEAETQFSQVREKYFPIVAKVLSGRSTATFFQLERRVSMMIELQLSSKIPLIERMK